MAFFYPKLRTLLYTIKLQLKFCFELYIQEWWNTAGEGRNPDECENQHNQKSWLDFSIISDSFNSGAYWKIFENLVK